LSSVTPIRADPLVFADADETLSSFTIVGQCDSRPRTQRE
jgi:hypothetical protein